MLMIPFPLLARFFVVAGFLLSASAALAQLSPFPAPERWVRPQLMIPSRAESPVVLQSVRQRVEVSGRLAFTEIEMTFYNPNRRILEGELRFPLLDRQSVTGFAMDVNGSLREAVPVEKALGQAVFEDITRGRIDPGLLELTQGNNFKLRVYPIPAAGTKRVVVRISEPLTERNGRQVYRLPLEYADRLAAFSLDMRIAGAAPTAAHGAFGNLNFVRDGDAFHARVERSDFAGRGVLEIEVPPQRGAQAITQSLDGKAYFYADVPLAMRSMRRAVPRLVSLVWDASGSGAARDHGREFALLDAYFKRMRDGEVRLTRIRNVAEPALKFRIADGDWRSLRKELEATAYDGATNLGAFVPDEAVREILLFSDGLANFGEQPFPAMRVPAYTVSAAVKADTLRLRHIAARSGARFVDLVADNPAEAAHKLLFATSRITHIDSRGASQLVLASPFVENGRVSFAGLLTEPAAALRIVVEHPGGASASFEVVARAGHNASTLAAAQWARLRIAELEGEYDLNRAEIRRLGKAFGLVTRNTSLIVLDQVADYARFDIAPPPELRAEYERLVQNVAQRRDTDRKTHLEQVVRMFEEKQAWWKRDFPKDDIAKIAAEAKINGAVAQDAFTRQRADRAEERVAPAMPATSAPASAASPAAKATQALNSAGRLAKAEAEPSQTTATIQLQKWQPDAPYAERMRSAATADLYRVYLDEKPGYANSTAFFLDAADVFFDRGLNELGIRVLGNLAEMDLENRHILRILGYRLVQVSEPGLAISVFRKVLALSPEEPQSYRDLGLAYAAARQPQKAIDTFYEVVIRPWHGRFPEIELITLAELNAVVATTNGGTRLDTTRMDARLLKNLPLDLRAVLTWDADNTDIDLWVTDPNGEKAFYGHRFTYQGGRMSLDFTGGYGPEEFSLKRAKPGKYKVEAQYFGDRRQNVTGPTTLQVRLTTKFGLPEQKEQIVTLRLNGRQEVVFVGEFEVTEDAVKR